MKKGDVFLHRSYLADDLKSKLRCRVTAVRRGRVYWRDDDEGTKGQMFFWLDEKEKSVFSVIEPGS